MEISEHITIVANEAKLLAEAAKRKGLDVDVPSCPGWDMRELVRHLGMIHLWAAGHMAERRDGSYGDELSELSESWPDLGVFWPEDDKLIDWYLETNANLVRTLESAPPDADAWTFLPAPSPRAMWARRQAHETAVHRFDAENASGTETVFDPIFASDGIDEMIMGFASRKGEFPIAARKTILVHTTDTQDRWHVTLAPDGVTAVRGDGSADATLTATATDLYLALWNRGDDSTISIAGDQDLLEAWHEGVRVRWS